MFKNSTTQHQPRHHEGLVKETALGSCYNTEDPRDFSPWNEIMVPKKHAWGWATPHGYFIFFITIPQAQTKSDWVFCCPKQFWTWSPGVGLLGQWVSQSQLCQVSWMEIRACNNYKNYRYKAGFFRSDHISSVWPVNMIISHYICSTHLDFTIYLDHRFNHFATICPASIVTLNMDLQTS